MVVVLTAYTSTSPPIHIIKDDKESTYMAYIYEFMKRQVLHLKRQVKHLISVQLVRCV